MDIEERGVTGQEMAVVLHEVLTNLKKKKIYKFFCLQDKKYYPTAEEVYGPDVEVGVVNGWGLTWV